MAATIGLGVTPAAAQSSFGARGFVTFGQVTFTAQESFDAILEKNSGPIVGGGGQVLLPWGLYAEVGVWQFKEEGERVFIGPNNQIFRLGIPVEITVMPVEVTGGYRFRGWDKFAVYGGGGFSSYKYKETSEFAEPGEDVDERFSGFHIVGGAEFMPIRWVGVGFEASWSQVKDALGTAGVSAAFDEDDLGGTTVRLKITVGR